MKKLVLFLTGLLLSASLWATVDAHDRVYLVVQDIQSGEFFLERAPIIGCYGLPRGPQLAQFTAEYKVNSNMGCGFTSALDNINYLTCAKVVSSIESSDYMSFSEVVLDISKCEAKNDKKFITMVRTAAKLNFPLKHGEVHLKLIK